MTLPLNYQWKINLHRTSGNQGLYDWTACPRCLIYHTQLRNTMSAGKKQPTDRSAKTAHGPNPRQYQYLTKRVWSPLLHTQRPEKHGSKLLFGGRRSSGGSGLDIQLIECAIPYTYRSLSVCDQKPRGLFVMQYSSEQLRVFLTTWLNLWFNSAQIQIHI